MKVFVLLCLATVAFAEKRNFLGDIGDIFGGGGELGSAAVKIAKCEATLHEAACISCCDSSFSGLFGFAERPACHAACKILPAPPVKRQFDWIGDVGKVAICEAKLHEDACIACCDSSFSGLLAFAEKPACHAACRVLPAKRDVVSLQEHHERRKVPQDIIIDTIPFTIPPLRELWTLSDLWRLPEHWLLDKDLPDDWPTGPILAS